MSRNNNSLVIVHPLSRPRDNSILSINSNINQVLVVVFVKVFDLWRPTGVDPETTIIGHGKTLRKHAQENVVIVGKVDGLVNGVGSEQIDGLLIDIFGHSIVLI